MNRKRIWIVNGVLALVLVWGGMRLRNEWGTFGASHQASLLEGAAARSDVKAPAEVAAAAAPDAAWNEIASRSPFSFDRNDANLEVTEAAAQPVSGPKPVLLGTLLLGNERLALMGKAGGDSRSASRVKTGQTFEGWQVVEIEDSAVVVTSNGTRESITVGRAPIVRSAEKTAPSTTPVANSTRVPAAVVPSQPAATFPDNTNALLGLGNRAPRPTNVPPGSRVVETPFGWKIEQDSK